MEKEKLMANSMGVPQGGCISPTIFNMVMNGVEETIMKTPKTFSVRYADDIIILSDDFDKLEKAKEDLEEFLKPRGLKLNEGKTKLVTIEEGFNFLGYNFKEYRYPKGIINKNKPEKKGTILVKPAKKSIEAFKINIREAMKHLGKTSAKNVILKLNPIIRG